jgi:cyanate permease
VGKTASGCKIITLSAEFQQVGFFLACFVIILTGNIISLCGAGYRFKGSLWAGN